MTMPAAEATTRVGRRAAIGSVVLSVTVVAIAVLPAFLTGALAVQMRDDFELPPPTLGLLVGLFFGCAALSSGPGGELVERIGALAGIRLAVLGAAVSMGGIALFAGAVPVVAALLVVGGLANGLAHPATNLMLVSTTPRRHRGLVLGIKQAAIPAATLLAGLSVPLFALTLGWRSAFAFAAAAGVLIAILARTPSRARPTPRESAGKATRIPRSAMPPLIALAVAAMLGIWGGQSMGAFLVSYGVDRGFDEATAGLVLTVGSLAGITSRVVAGHIVDRRASSGLPELGAMLLVGSLGLLALSTGIQALVWLGPVLAFAGGWGWTGVLNYAVVRAYPMAPAAATGIIQTGVFLGATLGVPAFGVIVDASSYPFAWLATAVSAVVAASVMLAIGKRR